MKTFDNILEEAKKPVASQKAKDEWREKKNKEDPKGAAKRNAKAEDSAFKAEQKRIKQSNAKDKKILAASKKPKQKMTEGRFANLNKKIKDLNAQAKIRQAEEEDEEEVEIDIKELADAAKKKYNERYECYEDQLSRDVKNKGYPQVEVTQDDLFDLWNMQIDDLNNFLAPYDIEIQVQGRMGGHWVLTGDIENLFDNGEPNEVFDELNEIWTDMINHNESITSLNESLIDDTANWDDERWKDEMGGSGEYCPDCGEEMIDGNCPTCDIDEYGMMSDDDTDAENERQQEIWRKAGLDDDSLDDQGNIVDDDADFDPYNEDEDLDDFDYDEYEDEDEPDWDDGPEMSDDLDYE